MGYLNYNGKILQDETLIAGADCRGLRYGDGVFETMKMLNGEIILSDEHLARLWKGMQVLQFDIPKLFTPEKLISEIDKLVLKNGHQQNARVRLQIIRGNGGLYDPQNHLPNYIIQSWVLADNNGQFNANGLTTGIFKDAKKSCDILSNIKHNNYLPYILAALQAKKEKWNDAFILNTYGRICDSTIANIFIIKNDIVSTPSLQEGCVAGIIRKELIRVIPKLLGCNIIEKEVTIDELMEADEVFLTNSMYNIRWVKQAGDRNYTNILTRKIFDVFSPTIS